MGLFMFGIKGVTMYKRGKNFFLEYRVSGKRVRKSLKTADKIEAEKKAQEIIDLLRIEDKTDFLRKIATIKKIKVSRLKLSDAWGKYLESPERKNPAKVTIEGYKSYVDQLFDWLKVEYIDEVSEDMAYEYCVWLASTGIKAQTYNKKKNFITYFFNILRRPAGLTDNPFSKMVNKEKEHFESQIISEEDAQKLLAAENLEDRILFSLGLLAGCRFKDACLMEWKHIDFKQKIISFKPAKTKRRQPNKRVFAPLLEQLENSLRKIEDQSGYVCPAWAEKYTNDRANALRACKRRMRNSGVEVIVHKGDKGLSGFHSFRHYFVTYCRLKNIPTAIIQSIVGQSSPQMVDVYTHIDQENTRKAFDIGSDEDKLEKIKAITNTLNDVKLRDKLLKILK